MNFSFNSENFFIFSSHVRLLYNWLFTNKLVHGETRQIKLTCSNDASENKDISFACSKMEGIFSLRIKPMNVCSMLYQLLRDFNIPTNSSLVQWGDVSIILNTYVYVLLIQEQFGYFCISPSCTEMQCCAAIYVLRVYRGTS